jgi:hypothetical protein
VFCIYSTCLPTSFLHVCSTLYLWYISFFHVYYLYTPPIMYSAYRPYSTASTVCICELLPGLSCIPHLSLRLLYNPSSFLCTPMYCTTTRSTVVCTLSVNPACVLCLGPACPYRLLYSNQCRNCMEEIEQGHCLSHKEMNCHKGTAPMTNYGKYYYRPYIFQ